MKVLSDVYSNLMCARAYFCLGMGDELKRERERERERERRIDVQTEKER